AKARAAAACTGLPALADDSGLCVDALGGAPGVRSARFAGEGASDEENNRLLLAQLTGLPAERRTATFRCAVAWVVPGPEPRECVRVGVCRGIVLEAPRGTGGFGYDPLFLVPEAGKTFAEMTLAEKEGVSHRGRALAAIRPVVAAWAASSRLRGR
ncbi:MAG: non-canonical purine NTP pyrophosphatase, partial [Clostridia bacterium]|nr:non-canonical purine NTP pyrophosphatase [Clostridia bacterium]